MAIDPTARIAAGARISTICDIDDAIYAAVSPQLG